MAVEYYTVISEKGPQFGDVIGGWWCGSGGDFTGGGISRWL